MQKVSIKQLPIPRRIFVIGDSHCLPLRDLAFCDPASGQTFVTAIEYCPGLAASSFLDGNGEFCESFRTGLINLGLVDSEGKATFLATDPNSLSVTFASGRPQHPPVLVVPCSEIDLRLLLIKRLGIEYDFILPFNSPYPESGKPLIPFDLLYEIVEKAIASLVTAIGALSNRGFTQVLAHCVPPPTLNDNLFESINEYLCPISIRYRAAFLWNHVLREKCQKAGIPLIDIWNDVTNNDGYLLPEYELDGVHLNRRAAMHTLEYVNGYLRNQRFAASYNTARYYLAHTIPPNEQQGHKKGACAVAGQTVLDSLREVAKFVLNTDESPSKNFKSNGFAVYPGIGKGLQGTIDIRTLECTAQSLYLLDWCYDATAFQEVHATRTPAPKIIELLFNLLYENPILGAIKECLGSDPIFYSATLFELHDMDLAEAPQLYFDYPHGVVQCLAPLIGGDSSGHWIFSDKAGNKKELAQPHGSIIIFDPSRLTMISHGGFAADAAFLILNAGSRHRNQPRLLVCTPLPALPVDPFQFSTLGLLTFPTLRTNEYSVNPRIFNIENSLR